jgi:arylsulfatase A-like enzyme
LDTDILSSFLSTIVETKYVEEVLNRMNSPSKKPNVIIVLSDDQGYGDLGCYGNPWLETPNLDALFSDSIRLSDFHTSPMCSPTRAALMSGKYPERVGVWSTLHGRYIMRQNHVTLGDIFQSAGYRTALFGKWHLGDNYPYRPTERGFDEVVTFGGGVIGETPDYWDNDYFDDVYSINGELHTFDGYCTDIWFNQLDRFISKNHEFPFFGYVATNAPHGPFNVDTKYTDKYLKKGVPEQRARFYGMIDNIDKNIGKLEKRLQELELFENTIIIYMGDNGTSIGTALDDHGYEIGGYNAGLRGKKCSPYEGGHKNACFIRWGDAGIKGGRNLDGLTLHIDIMPTLAELCGIEISDSSSVDGISFAQGLHTPGRSLPERLAVIDNMQLDTPIKYKDFVVLSNRWRLVQTEEFGLNKPELYDYLADPGQKKNLIDSYPDVVDFMLTVYDSWWDQISEQFDEYSRIPIGSSVGEETKLTCHSWHGCTEKVFNQIHVREGIMDNGYWVLEAAAGGVYRIELWRWPKETGKGLSSSIKPIVQKPFVHDRPLGKAYSIVEAGVNIQGNTFALPVSADDDCAVFFLALIPGEICLESRFVLSDGTSIGAYYAYITLTNEILSDELSQGLL